jgi:hypothetical protein
MCRRGANLWGRDTLTHSVMAAAQEHAVHVEAVRGRGGHWRVFRMRDVSRDLATVLFGVSSVKTTTRKPQFVVTGVLVRLN